MHSLSEIIDGTLEVTDDYKYDVNPVWIASQFDVYFELPENTVIEIYKRIKYVPVKDASWYDPPFIAGLSVLYLDKTPFAIMLFDGGYSTRVIQWFDKNVRSYIGKHFFSASDDVINFAMFLEPDAKINDYWHNKSAAKRHTG